MGTLPRLDQIECDGPLLECPAFPSNQLCLEDVCKVLDSMRADRGLFILMTLHIQAPELVVGEPPSNWRIKSHLF